MSDVLFGDPEPVRDPNKKKPRFAAYTMEDRPPKWDPREDLCLWPVTLACHSQGAYAETCLFLTQILKRESKYAPRAKITYATKLSDAVSIVERRTIHSMGIGEFPTVLRLLLSFGHHHLYRHSDTPLSYAMAASLDKWQRKPKKISATDLSLYLSSSEYAHLPAVAANLPPLVTLTKVQEHPASESNKYLTEKLVLDFRDATEDNQRSAWERLVYGMRMIEETGKVGLL